MEEDRTAAEGGRDQPGGRIAGAVEEAAAQASGFVLPATGVLTGGRTAKRVDADSDRQGSGSTGDVYQAGSRRTTRFVSEAARQFVRWIEIILGNPWGLLKPWREKVVRQRRKMGRGRARISRRDHKTLAFSNNVEFWIKMIYIGHKLRRKR